MTAFATHTDLEARWRPLSAAEQAVADTLLSDVSAMFRKKISTLDAMITAGSVDPLLVKLAAVTVVRRAMSNPGGTKNETETVGPFSHQVTYAAEQWTLFVTDDDLTTFLPTSGSRTVGTIHVRTASLKVGHAPAAANAGNPWC